jgi:hypothetical protein
MVNYKLKVCKVIKLKVIFIYYFIIYDLLFSYKVHKVIFIYYFIIYDLLFYH